MGCPELLWLADERWLPVGGYEGLYDISDQGRVWSERKHIFLKPCVNPKTGRLSVFLCSYPAKPKPRYVHHLVLEHFVGPRPTGLEACHWDDDGANNRLDNLRWDTRSANKIDAVRNGRNPSTRKTRCPQGHEYTLENTIHCSNGTGPARRCRKCQRAKAAKAYKKRVAA